jgi:hypothetical protein
VPSGSTGVMIFLHFFLKFSIVNYQFSIIHYIITPPRLRRYPSYLKRGVGSHLPYNRPLILRGQALPTGSAGVMIFLYFWLLVNSQLSIINCQLSIIVPTSSPHRGTRSAQKACRQLKDKLFESRRISSGRVICLLANKQLSGRWGDAVLIFFASFFASRQKKDVGFGAKPQESINHVCSKKAIS